MLLERLASSHTHAYMHTHTHIYTHSPKTRQWRCFKHNTVCFQRYPEILSFIVTMGCNVHFVNSAALCCGFSILLSNYVGYWPDRQAVMKTSFIVWKMQGNMHPYHTEHRFKNKTKHNDKKMGFLACCKTKSWSVKMV